MKTKAENNSKNKRFTKRMVKKPFNVINPIPLKHSIAILATACVGIGGLLFFRWKKAEALKQKIFDIVTNNCSSSGVNKMKIVSDIYEEFNIEIEKSRKISYELAKEKEKNSELEIELAELKAKFEALNKEKNKNNNK